MKRLLNACLLLAGLCSIPASVYAASNTATTNTAKKCPTTFNPGSFTKGDFFTNFNNSCYLIPFSSGNGSGSEQGDLNSIYNKIFYCASTACEPAGSNIPPFQLVIVGDFPNARYFAVGLYDDHSANTQNITDVNVVPLTSGDVNPFQPGVAFLGNQRYAVPINLGGTPGTLEAGCVMTGYNVTANTLDGTQRHAFMNWNLSPGFFKSNPGQTNHEVDTPLHSNPNASGVILIRNYLTVTNPIGVNLPHIIVRDVASGCAYPASMVNAMGILTTDSDTGNTWLNQAQVQNHNVFANWQPTDCWDNLPPSQSVIQWIRGDEYTPGANPDSSYLYAYTPAGLPATLAAANEVMRFRFRVPTTPQTPCTNGCARSGNEQMRYMSISFQTTGGGTLASLPDSCPLNPLTPCTPLVQDANGFVTLVVGTGVAQPSWVTAANGYTWLDLTQSTTANYQDLNQVDIRNILSAAAFTCGGEMVPYKTGEATATVKSQNAVAGVTGLYAPEIDYPVASTLPTTASELTGPSSCAMFPKGPPQVSPNCAVGTENNNPVIGSIVSLCSSPPGSGCNQVYAQPQLPLSILSQNGTGGFGTFPLGLPYTGNSNFIQITDTTQNWSAGYTGDTCNVTVGEWSDTAISLVANVDVNGVCPLAAGDNLLVTVYNPQTPANKASLAVTVQAPTSVVRKP